MRSAKTALMRSSRVAKRRDRVALPTHGLAGDAGHGDAEAVAGVQAAGRGQDAFAVTLGVGKRHSHPASSTLT